MKTNLLRSSNISQLIRTSSDSEFIAQDYNLQRMRDPSPRLIHRGHCSYCLALHRLPGLFCCSRCYETFSMCIFHIFFKYSFNFRSVFYSTYESIVRGLCCCEFDHHFITSWQFTVGLWGFYTKTWECNKCLRYQGLFTSSLSTGLPCP